MTMNDFQEEDILEVLNNIFMKCDVHEKGSVDVDTLVSFITSQDLAWQEDIRIESEIRRLLYCDNSNQVITQSYFTSTLLNWFKTYYESKKSGEEDEVVLPGLTDGKCSSQSSGIGDEEITPTHSLNEAATVDFVSDGQSYASEDIVEDISVEDRENLRSHIKLMESEVSHLQRENESLETANNSLLAKVSTLKHNYDKEAFAYLKKVESYNELLEKFKKKEEDAAFLQNVIDEYNKSANIQLSQYEKEKNNSEDFIKRLENQVEILTNEKQQQSEKIQKLKENINALTDLYKKCTEDLEAIRVKEEVGKHALEKMYEENKTLHAQIGSNTLLVQTLKADLAAANKKLSTLQLANITSKLEFDSSYEGSTTENSIIFYEKNEPDNTKPIEMSLLAELQDMVLCSDRVKNVSFLSTSSISTNTDFCDITDEKIFKDSSTMTDKITETTTIFKQSCEVCHSYTRSPTRWLYLGFFIILLSFGLGFVISSAVLILSLLNTPSHLNCLHCLTNTLPITVKYPAGVVT